jgi:hypothetical protein
VIRTVFIAVLLLGISPFGVAQNTSAANRSLDFSNADGRNVTAIAKNQIHPLRIELLRDPCAAAPCIAI